MELTKEQARKFLLIHQQLYPPRRLKGKKGIMEYIRRVGCIQYDPLNLVGRNPDLVLQSRISDYKEDLLTNLLYKQRGLLDGWDKNMSIFAVEDWPYFKRIRQRTKQRIMNRATYKHIEEVLPAVREVINKKGPLSSLDLGNKKKLAKKVDWSWAPTKLARIALESMYWWGELVVHHRVGTRKVYDLTERCLPPDIIEAPDPNSSEVDYLAWHIKRRVGGVGLIWARASDAWLGIEGRGYKETIQKLHKQGELKEIKIKGLSEPFYMRKEEDDVLQAVLSNREAEDQAAIIAPLDNFIWDRKLVKRLFGFEYIWEVYKPVSERKYGYYVLPVLLGDRFVARFEPVIDRENKKLMIKNWWWEVPFAEDFKPPLVSCFKQFLSYTGTAGIEVQKGNKELAWLREVTV